MILSDSTFLPPPTNRKGIVLAGGNGTRLYPLTSALSKQLLPVYDKPMIYYPICTLLLAGIKDILVISSPEHLSMFQTLLGDGARWGISISYAEQAKPEGIAQAFILGEQYIGNDPVCLILGDNIFYGHGLAESLHQAETNSGATIFGYYVKDPQRYGVVAFDKNNKVINIEEKPLHPQSHYAVTGIYFYDHHVVDIAKQLTPSPRGELEITDVNNIYLQQSDLHVELLGRGIAWLDTGTHESLVQATNFVRAVEDRQGLKIACPEEIAWRFGYITAADLEKQAKPLVHTSYGDYLLQLLMEEG